MWLPLIHGALLSVRPSTLCATCSSWLAYHWTLCTCPRHRRRLTCVQPPRVPFFSFPEALIDSRMPCPPGGRAQPALSRTSRNYVLGCGAVNTDGPAECVHARPPDASCRMRLKLTPALCFVGAVLIWAYLEPLHQVNNSYKYSDNRIYKMAMVAYPVVLGIWEGAAPKPRGPSRVADCSNPYCSNPYGRFARRNCVHVLENCERSVRQNRTN